MEYFLHSKTEEKLDLIIRQQQLLLRLIEKGEKRMSHSIQDLIAEVATQATQVESLKSFVTGLRKQLADALAASGAASDTLAHVDAVFDAVHANSDAIASAMVEAPAPAAVAPAAPAA